MKVTEFRIDFLSNFLSLDESRQKEAINNLSKDSAKLIELFKYATDQNANHLIDVKVIKSIFEKIEILDIDESLNESQIKDTVKLIKQIFPSQAESELKNIYDNFLIKHVDADNINLSNVFSYLKDAKRINATGTIAKCLQFIQNTMGVTLKVENSTLSIDIIDLKISWEELSSQIELLSNIYKNQIAISYTAQASDSPLAVKQFITKHGNLISSLDLQNLKDKVNDDLTKELIKSCPNIHHIFIKSTIISNDGLKELSHLTSLSSLHLSDCYGLTALPAKFPESLTSLDLTNCYGLKDLPAKLPESLTSLNLTNCHGLKALPANLPESLTNLDISYCSGLKALPANLPGSLTSLNLSGCTGLKALPAKLPESLTSLNLTYCSALTALLANLPESLTSLNLSNCRDLRALLANLPGNLTSLNLSNCRDLRALLANLPGNLTSLNLSYCSGLTALPAKLPESLTSLDLSNCSGLTALPANLPGSLTSLKLYNCSGLKDLPANLPENLTSLNLSYCSALTALLANLPESLTSLDLSYCSSLTALPAKLPESLTSLNLTNCYSLEDLPAKLPESLTSLNLTNCYGLEDLPAKLPESLTSLNLTNCYGLKDLPAKLPGNLTSLNLSKCYGLKDLPAKLPESLTSLNLSFCRDLKDLPANLPGNLTSLNLSYCRELKDLPANLPGNLTSLDLFGCSGLTDDAKLPALSNLVRSNPERGLRHIKDFMISNRNKLYHALVESLSDEPLALNQDPLNTLLNILQKKLSSESGNSIQVALAQFISDNQSELLLHDEHLLMQEAIEILSSNSIPGEKNPYSLFKKLKDLSQERTEFSPSMIEVEGVSVAILMPQLIEMARGSKINRSQLPKNVTKQVWDELFQALENKVKGSPVANEILKNLNSSWNEVSEAVPYLSGLLSLQGENVSDPEAQWRAILSSILEKNHAPRTDFYFTEQEEALITVLVGIGHCGPKKNEGILTNYLLLDHKYHYQIKPPKWRSAEKTKELEGKEAAINFIRKFIQPHEGKTIEEKVTLFKKFINNQEDIEKFHKNTAIILPFASPEDWDVFDVKNKKGETLWLTRLTDEGAISVLKAFTQEEDKQAAEERAAQFVTGIVKNLMDSQFASDNEIIQELTGINDMPQGVHQVLYMKNLIGHLVGVSRGPVFDRYTGVLYDHLLAIPRDEVLKIFFKHVTPERLIDEVVLVVNLNLKENRGLLAPLLQKGSSKDGSFTRQEAMSLLNQLDFLTTSPPLH